MGTNDAQTVFVYHLCLAAANKEGHVFSSFRQTAAEISPDGARADYQCSHRRIMWDLCFTPQFRQASIMKFRVACCNRTKLVVYCICANESQLDVMPKRCDLLNEVE